MFKSFLKPRPQVSIFHYAQSPQSNRALEMLRTALTNPYPKGNPHAGPLEFDLEVVESAPTPDQIKTIQSYVSTSNLSSTFLSSHPTAPPTTGSPSSAPALVNLARRSPTAIKWPIVVDWMNGRASIGDVDGVQRILEEIRKERDGESS